MRSTRAMITSTLEPIAAGFFAFFFIGEKLEPLQISGGILVISAIVLLQLHREQDAWLPLWFAAVLATVGAKHGKGGDDIAQKTALFVRKILATARSL